MFLDKFIDFLLRRSGYNIEHSRLQKEYQHLKEIATSAISMDKRNERPSKLR